MYITIGDERIVLNDNEVKAAKHLVGKFMKNIDEASKKTEQPTFYFTTLIIMHLMSSMAIDEIEPKQLKLLMEAFENARNE